MRRHEEYHKTIINCTQPPCTATGENGFYSPDKGTPAEECVAYGIDLNCLRGKKSLCQALKDAKQQAKCESEIEQAIRITITNGNSIGCLPAGMPLLK